jgi:hypothetical protein
VPPAANDDTQPFAKGGKVDAPSPHARDVLRRYAPLH